MSRRETLRCGGGLALAGFSFGAVTTFSPGGGRAFAADPAITADQALALLMEGNARYAQLWQRGRRRSP
jgi:hypothetical protein